MSSFYNPFWQPPQFFLNYPQFHLNFPFQGQVYNQILTNEHLFRPEIPNDHLSPSPSPTPTSRIQPQVNSDVPLRKRAKRNQEDLGGVRGDQNFTERNQNKDRNMLSYILKGYVHLIVESRQMLQIVKRTSNKLKIENGVTEFMNYIRQKFPLRRTYVGLRYVRRLVRQAASDPMALILAVTLKHYLSESYSLIVLHKQQVTKKVRLKCLKKAKELFILLFFK